MTTQPAAECEHPANVVRWESGCCGVGYIYDLDIFHTGRCRACKRNAVFALVCKCGATVEATGRPA